MKLELKEHELSGARLTVPFTALQQLGPKHHAIVIGKCVADETIWLAELSRKFGYRIVPLTGWINDNQKYIVGMKLQPNSGPRSNWEVAQSALREVLNAKENTSKYDVMFNNCETFANRHLKGQTTLSPQVKKTLQMLGFIVVGGAYLFKNQILKMAKRSV